MDSQSVDEHSALPLWAGIRQVDERLAQAAQAFARVMRELEDGHWHLRNWAEELGISEDEMFIELDRRLHQPVAA